MKYTEKDLNKILSHPHVQKISVLSKLVGVLDQNIINWISRGRISKLGLDKINSCEHLTSLDFNEKKPTVVKVDKNWVSLLLLSRTKTELASEFGETIQTVHNWDVRNKIPKRHAKQVAKIFKVTPEEIRPDVPRLFWVA